IGERDLRPPWRPGDRPVDPDRADALDRLACLRRAEAVGFRPSLRGEGIDPQAAREAARVRDDLIRLIHASDEAAKTAAGPQDSLVPRLLLAAYPDRLAKRTAPTANRALMVGGIAVEIDRGSCLTAPTGKPRPELFCAYAVQGVGQGGRHATMVRQGAELDEAEVEVVFPGAIQRRELVSYDQQRQSVATVVGWYYHDLCLRANPGAQVDAGRIAACLAEALASQARALFDEDEVAASFLRRAAWLRVQCPELEVPTFADAALGELVLSLCAGCRSRADVVAKPKLPWLIGGLPHALTRAIDEQAPATLLVPTGNRITLQYDDPARPPVLAVRLQELFGQRETPRIANGQVAVLLHLLGPNYRAEQVTQDLASFWRNTYPQVRKDLRSRYPKHAWPEDPLSAAPVARGRPTKTPAR
ncbi:MAG: ATP-dependent helicase HrpB, partial [Planctomycetes bacterium]|nr:ATP-dependent helicase HrpB [Planctomycetota bacterium]